MDTGASQTPSVNWSVPGTSGEPLQIALNGGDCLFVVGPNGSGKSALIQHLVSSHQVQNIRRVSAHRQTWLGSGSLNLTPLGRKQFEQNSTSMEREYEALWQEYYSEEKQSAVLFDLVAKDNTRARSIAGFVDCKDWQGAEQRSEESVSAFAELNDLLALETGPKSPGWGEGFRQ